MIESKPFIIFTILLCLLVQVGCGLQAEAMTEKRGKSSARELTVIEGKVSVKGNEPHTYLCLTTVSGIDYKIIGSQKDHIYQHLQQKKVRLEGEVVKKKLGPGIPAEFDVIQIITDL